jgi:hypothetical protein
VGSGYLGRRAVKGQTLGDEIELVSDGDGLVVVGDQSAVERFLDQTGLLPEATRFSLARLSSVMRTGAELAETASEIAERSAFYLKLTPESVERIRAAGGLMETDTEGISHIMLGVPGKIGGWLQAEDGPSALLTNPAVLSGLGGLMTQLAQQAEANDLKALLVRMDEKLDDVRRAQRNSVLAKLQGAAATIEEAMILRERGGDPETLWSKVSSTSETVHEVQSAALLALGALAEKVEGKRKTGELKKATQEIEQQVVIQFAILGRCFELQDQFAIVELDYVLTTAPQHLDGHRLGLAETRRKRREEVLERTTGLMKQMDAAGGIANENILLHVRAARAVVDNLNTTAAAIEEFHEPLGIESGREKLDITPWSEALRDPQQLKRAGAEAGKAAVVAGAVVGTALRVVGARNGPTGKA